MFFQIVIMYLIASVICFAVSLLFTSHDLFTFEDMEKIKEIIVQLVTDVNVVERVQCYKMLREQLTHDEDIELLRQLIPDLHK